MVTVIQNPLPIPKRETHPYSFSCVSAKRGHVSRTGYPIKMVTVIQNPLPIPKREDTSLQLNVLCIGVID